MDFVAVRPFGLVAVSVVGLVHHRAAAAAAVVDLVFLVAGVGTLQVYEVDKTAAVAGNHQVPIGSAAEAFLAVDPVGGDKEGCCEAAKATDPPAGILRLAVDCTLVAFAAAGIAVVDNLAGFEEDTHLVAAAVTDTHLAAAAVAAEGNPVASILAEYDLLVDLVLRTAPIENIRSSLTYLHLPIQKQTLSRSLLDPTSWSSWN